MNFVTLTAVILLPASTAFALDGQIQIHDPSTLVECDGKYYTFGTGGVEDCNAIDPGLLLDPNNGRLWMVYGSYFGYIRLVELAVESVPVGGRRARRGPPGLGGFGASGGTNAATDPPGGGISGGPGRGPIPPQDVAQVSTNWPAGTIDVRLAAPAGYRELGARYGLKMLSILGSKTETK